MPSKASYYTSRIMLPFFSYTCLTGLCSPGALPPLALALVLPVFDFYVPTALSLFVPLSLVTGFALASLLSECSFSLQRQTSWQPGVQPPWWIPHSPFFTPLSPSVCLLIPRLILTNLKVPRGSRILCGLAAHLPHV